MIPAKYNANDKLPDWSISHSNGLTTFYSNELRLKKVITNQQWIECSKVVGFDINSEVSIYDSLEGICDYFIKLSVEKYKKP